MANSLGAGTVSYYASVQGRAQWGTPDIWRGGGGEGVLLHWHDRGILIFVGKGLGSAQHNEGPKLGQGGWCSSQDNRIPPT